MEYLVIDGASTDGTVELVGKFATRITNFVSEPDAGIYDAMNKGIKAATGDVIGILNADDVFADEDVLSTIARAYAEEAVDIVYGDLDYVNLQGRVIRKWRSKPYSHGMFNRGWMPAHPTFYCRRDLFKDFGGYNAAFGTAADYELMLRFMHLHKAKAVYINKVFVKMMTGGASNSSYRNRLKVLRHDIRAMHKNGIEMPLLTLIIKVLSKVKQFF